MVIMIDPTPKTPLPTSRAHSLRSLKRHVSAPGRPSLALDVCKARETQQKVNTQRSPSYPHTPATSSRSKSDLVHELSMTHSATTRLRLDRDEWRTTVQLQANQILYHKRDSTRQLRMISVLEEQNALLQTQHARAIEDKESLFAHFETVITKHDKLVDQLNEANRDLARMKKSDRAKGKVQQRNLRLKATLKRIGMRATEKSAPGDVDKETALMEALALASERIEELEGKGEALVEALEKRSDSDGETEDDAVGLVQAEVTFRGLLDDEMFKEQKERWEDLLEE